MYSIDLFTLLNINLTMMNNYLCTWKINYFLWSYVTSILSVCKFWRWSRDCYWKLGLWCIRGDPELKAMLQWLVPLRYMNFQISRILIISWTLTEYVLISTYFFMSALSNSTVHLLQALRPFVIYYTFGLEALQTLDQVTLLSVPHMIAW